VNVWEQAMPSKALLDWQTNRVSRLGDSQCDATSVLVPPNPQLADENLRGFVMLLSAHFQGFCRDLHSECVQAVADAVAQPMRFMIQTQCVAGRELDGANPRYDVIRKDFERFGLDLRAALTANPATAAANTNSVTLIGHLNLWRNYAAHHKTSMPTHGGPFALATVRVWKQACAGLAAELDGIMYNQLRTVLGKAPW
jgi:hypothetical protein